MDETFSTEAIILNRQPWREHDLLISLYTPEKGRLDLVARGARKKGSKLAGHIEPISFSKIMVIKGKKIDYLGSAINENLFLKIKENIYKAVIAGKAINIFKKLIKPLEPDKDIYLLLKDFLIFLNNSEISKHELWSDLFIFKLIIKLGYTPELFYCVKCKNKIAQGKNYFDFSRGGIICIKCETGNNQIQISENAIKILRLALVKDFDELNKIKIENKLAKEINFIIERFYQYYLNI